MGSFSTMELLYRLSYNGLLKTKNICHSRLRFAEGFGKASNLKCKNNSAILNFDLSFLAPHLLPLKMILL